MEYMTHADSLNPLEGSQFINIDKHQEILRQHPKQQKLLEQDSPTREFLILVRHLNIKLFLQRTQQQQLVE
jgi:hypothetical protein